MGKHQKAIKDYDEAIRLKPDYTEAIDERALAYTADASENKQRQEIEKMATLEPQHKKLEAQHHELVVKKKPLTTAECSALINAKEIAKDGRFIAYDNGTVVDTSTQLMWAAKASKDLSWEAAKKYCGNYRLGGHTDWRLPTGGELGELHEDPKTIAANSLFRLGFLEIWDPQGYSCTPHLKTKLISLKKYHAVVWALGKRFYNFSEGKGYAPPREGLAVPCLPVREFR